MKFFDELKRRNVIKATMAYIVVSWVLIQVLTVILPVFQAPEWALKILMILMVIGLPIWVIFSWVYDVTPEGLKKTEQFSTDRANNEITNKRLNVIIVVMLLIAIGVSFINKPVPKDSAQIIANESNVKNAIAVLPFMDVSPDKDQEYLSDGIAIEIYDELCKFKELTVAGRTSSFSFKNKNESLTSIGDQLNVNAILEGTVRRQQDKILISISLVNATDGFIIFSESYADDFENIFVLQSKIANDIASKIESNLGLKGNAVQPGKKIDPMAYETFLKGKLQFVNGPVGVADEMMKAKKYFEIAVKQDSSFAEASAYLALAYFNLADWAIERSETSKIEMALDSAKLLAHKALSLDSLSSGAQMAMGSYYFHQHEWVLAEKFKSKAVALNPGGAEEKFNLSSFLSQFGQPDKALLLSEEAMKLDPLSTKGKIAFARDLYTSGKYDECIRFCHLILEEDPGQSGADQFLWLSYIMKKDYEKAGKTLAHYSEAHYKDSIAASLFRENDFKTAVKKLLIKDKESQIRILHNSFFAKATFWAFIGDKENTIKNLYKTYDNKEPMITYIRDARFDFIRDDPRYIELYEKTGFKAYDVYKAAERG